MDIFRVDVPIQVFVIEGGGSFTLTEWEMGTRGVAGYKRVVTSGDKVISLTPWHRVQEIHQKL